mgnify:CR=1 FL=1
MMAQPWLPDACLTSRRAAQPIVNVIEAWTKNWFKRSAWQVLGNWDEALPQSASDFQPMRRARGFEITGKNEAEITLALAILGAERESPQTNDDRDLLQKLGKCVIDDLEARIAETLPHEEVFVHDRLAISSPRLFSLLIGPIGEAQIALECPIAQLVRMTRGTYSNAAIAPQMTTCAEALADQTVEISARLGSARNSLKDLAELEVGDVLLLDSAPDQPSDLMVNGKRSALSFTIVDDHDAYTLEFQEKQ